MYDYAQSLFLTRKFWRRRRYAFRYERTSRLEKNRCPFGTYWWVNVQGDVSDPDISRRLHKAGNLLTSRKRWGRDRRKVRDEALYWRGRSVQVYL